MLKIEITASYELDADFFVRLTHSEFGTIFCENCQWYNLKNVIEDIRIKTKDLTVEYSDENSYYMD